MKLGNLIFFGAAFALLLGLSACSLDEVLLEGETGDGSVSFKVVAGNATRTSATTTNNIKSFSVWAWNDSNEFMDCVTAIKGDNGTFTTSPLYFWPNGTVDFYALSPTAMGYAVDTGVEYAYLGGQITIDEDDEGGEHWSYTGNVARATIAEDNISIDAYIPGSAEDQIDLCYAVAKGYDSTCGSVPMNFRHALSQIVFKAKDANEDFAVDVAGVSVCSVYKQGTYVLKGVPSTTEHLDEGDSTSPVSSSQGEWSTESHKARYAAGVTAQTLPTSGETVTLTSEGGALMLLPQTVEAWDPDADPTDKELGAYIRILCHVEEHGSVLWPTDAEKENGAITVGEDGKDYAEIAVPVDIDWEEGYRYTYTIIFGNGLGYYLPDDPNADLDGTPVLKIITFEVSVDEFQNAEDVYVHTDTPVEISFSELRDNYATGEPIEDNVYINGIVVSNKEYANAGCPILAAQTTVDFTPSTKTVYLESEDGEYGIAIMCDKEEDNIFDQFDRVTLKLTGTTLTKKGNGGTCPTRYELTGFKSSMVSNQEAGEDAPEKERTIGTLTADDVYTYVKLTDVQLPIRKGPLVPVDGGFATDASSPTLTKYPLLVIDKEGNDLYMLTNDMCPYRRDGTRLPYGSGNLHGVVVHEHFSRFADWETQYGAEDGDGNLIYNDANIEDYAPSLGYIGKFQLRHQVKDDVWGEMEDDFEKGFAALLCEYRYKVIKDSKIIPSYGTKDASGNLVLNGYMTHSDTDYSGTNSTHFAQGSTTYDYIGPTGTSSSGTWGANYGNKNGIGILIDADHEDYSTYRPSKTKNNRDGVLEMACEYATHSYCGYGTAGWSEENAVNESYVDVLNYGSTSNRGKAQTGAGAEMDMPTTYWWDYDTNTPYSILVFFSTEGITSDVVTMQLYMRGYSGSLYTPLYWTAEWAESEDAESWTKIGDFIVPEPIMTSSYNNWAFCGHKAMNFKLPASILGKENVVVRIHPTSDVCGNGTTFASSKLSDGSGHGVSLSYFAIRYNR